MAGIRLSGCSRNRYAKTMTMKARDIMQSKVRTIAPDVPLPDLERKFIADRVSGFPVVRDQKLLGIVSRSDIVRQLCVEQSLAETVSDFHRDVDAYASDPIQSFQDIARRVGQRIEHLTVKDVMIRDVITVEPEQSLSELAQVLCKHRIHRVPVTEQGRLVGIITTLDLVRLFAEDRVEVKS